MAHCNANWSSMKSAVVKRGFENKLSEGLMADPIARSSLPTSVRVKQTITGVYQNRIGNFKILFKAVDREQAKRGNL